MVFDPQTAEENVKKFNEKLAAMESEVDGINEEVKEEEVKEPEPEKKETSKEAIEKETKTIPEKSSYVPNKKYSVRGKEFEFDKDFDAIITSKEVEDKIRNLYVKADGLEAIQKQRDTLKQTLDTASKELETIAPAKALYEKASQLIEQGNIEEGAKCLTAAMLSVFSQEEIDAVYAI